MKQNKILITGGTGFIGYHLSKRCIKLGWSVTSLSSNFPKPNKIIRGVKYIIVDINNAKMVSKKDFFILILIFNYFNKFSFI